MTSHNSNHDPSRGHCAGAQVGKELSFAWQHMVLHFSGQRKSNFDFSRFPQENIENVYVLAKVQFSVKEARGVHVCIDCD